MGMIDKAWALRVFKFLGMTCVTVVVHPSFPKDRDIPNWFCSGPHWSGGRAFPQVSIGCADCPPQVPHILRVSRLFRCLDVCSEAKCQCGVHIKNNSSWSLFLSVPDLKVPAPPLKVSPVQDRIQVWSPSLLVSVLSPCMLTLWGEKKLSQMHASVLLLSCT